MYERIATVAWALTLSLAGGCTSMNSTMITRDESNHMWQRHPHLHGVPITLKVPTHLKVNIFERHFLRTKTVGDITTVERMKLPFVLRDFNHDFVYSEKIFTVDFKRPAAGLYNLRLEMTDDQYIDKVQHDVTDKTIEQVTNVVKAFAPSGVFPSVFPASDSADIDAALEEIESVVAVGLFEIDDPEFEAKLANFINCHLNQSHDAFTVGPDVTEINRVRTSEHLSNGNLCTGPAPVMALPSVAEKSPQQRPSVLPVPVSPPSLHAEPTY